MRPIIGISAAWSCETWPKEHKEKNKFTPNFYYVGNDYVNAIYELGGIPLLISPSVNSELNEIDMDNIFSRIDGLLLSGGGDIGINSGGSFVAYLKEQQSKRYDFESALIKKAWKYDIPTIGICRGHQMIAEVLGGTISDKPIPYHSNIDGISNWNTLEVLPNTLLQKVVESDHWRVNSYHTQVVLKLPSSFNVSAISVIDNVIEAIEAVDKKFFVGVQFHPEKLISKDDKSKKLLTHFIQKARERNN